jgi:diguanylate cyclase (GGDEF)-like protein
LARYGLPEELVRYNIADLIHPDDVAAAMSSFAAVSGRPGHHQALSLRLASDHSVEAVADNQLDNPEVGLVVFNIADPDDRRRSARLLQAQGEVVRQVALGGSVEAAITEVLRFVESALPGSLAVAYAPPGLTEITGPSAGPWTCLAAPSATPQLTETVADHLTVEAFLPGSMALADQEVVIASDLTEPRWRRFSTLVGTRVASTWSVPIRYDKTADTYGLIEIYGLDTGHPRDDEWAILHLSSRMAAIAVDHSRMQRRLRRDALVDPLTSVPNRRVLTRRLDDALSGHDGCQIVCFIDLDRLKIVNDSLGHEAGDQVIRQAADRLTDAIGDQGLVGRFGGDEFVAIVPAGRRSHEQVADACLAAFQRPFDVGGRQWQLTASLGVVVTDGASTSTEVLRDADAAMYEAKRAGRGCWRLFDAATRDQVVRRMSLESALRQDISQGRLTAHFQPIVRSADWSAAGAEALARWRLPDGGNVPPGEFIPLAEELGLIDDLGCQLVEQAVAAIGRLGEWSATPYVSVNISALQLQSSRLFDQLDDLNRCDPQACRQLCLEMTEQHVVDESDLTLDRIHRLVRCGVGLAIDDFGTGYSSLGALHRLPATQLKIDWRLNSRVGTAGGDAVVAAAVGVARAYGMTTVAEGVETAEQARRLRDLKVDFQQGYLFARPEPLDEVAQRLSSRWPWLVSPRHLDGHR